MQSAISSYALLFLYYCTLLQLPLNGVAFAGFRLSRNNPAGKVRIACGDDNLRFYVRKFPPQLKGFATYPSIVHLQWS